MQQDNGLEFKVGAFVLLALAVVAVLMIIFGRLGEGFDQTYGLTVSFPNANGLLKGADVALAGATVGRVDGAPEPLPEGNGVLVHLKVFKKVKVRQDSAFSVGEVGMLGDRNVQIDPVPGSQAPFLQDGAQIDGTRAPGLASLTAAAQPVIDELREISTKLNEDLLTPQTTADLQVTVKNLRSITTRFDALLAKAESGKGAVSRLLTDPKTANDLSAFIFNLRKKGILFYSDVASEDQKKDRK